MMDINSLFLLGLLVGAVIMYLVIEITKRCWISSSGYKVMEKVIISLGRGIGRWRTAAEQDENAMIAVLHSNYAAGYLWALLDIATPQQIEQALGINYEQMRDAVVNTQDKSTKKMAVLCPAYAPEPSVLTKLAGEG